MTIEQIITNTQITAEAMIASSSASPQEVELADCIKLLCFIVREHQIKLDWLRKNV